MPDDVQKRIESILQRLHTRTSQLLWRAREGQQRSGFMVVLLCMGLGSSCANPSVTQSVRTHDIQIRDHVSPPDLYVSAGDEVRWHNLRADPIKIGLLSHHQLDLVS